MDEPPDSSEPEDVTPSSLDLPRVFDLKNGEECLMKTNTLESLHVVQPPAWYLGPGTTNGPVLPENLLNSSLQPVEALSGTTVTLSYLTRSHVYEPQIYTIPLSKAFSLYPALPGALPGAQPCLDPAPPCLDNCTSPFHFVTPAPVAEDTANLCFLQQPQDVDGIQNGATWNGNFPTFSDEENTPPELVFLISRPGESTGLAVPLNPELINALDPSRLPPVTLASGIKNPQTGPPSPRASPEGVSNTTHHEPSPKQNGNVAPEELAPRVAEQCNRTPARKVLPPRSTRGMRLEAIVQNMYPTRFKSSHASSSKKSRTNQTANKDASAKHSVLEEDCLTNEVESRLRVKEQSRSTSNSRTVLRPSSGKKTRRRRRRPWHKSSNKSRGDEENVALSSKRSPNDSRENEAALVSPNCSPDETREDEEHEAALPQRSPSERNEAPTCSPTRTLSKRSSRGKSLVKAVDKVKKAKLKKKQQLKARKTSAFLPQEPEIRLRILENKDTRKERRDETFTPFVRVDLRANRTCTVVNYPDEGARLSRGEQRTHQSSGKIPASSSVLYGRVSMEGPRRAWLVCCLCGGAANATDLGDLHGPYYSEGVCPGERRAGHTQESREDDSTDSDFPDVDRRLQGAPPGLTASGPAAKRARTDGGVDWYTPPMVPVHESEFWFHEDCGVWSAGVFVVRGKVFGLENAVKEARRMVCSCCHKPGASLGCFFKNCPNKYHYLCAIQSGCILNRENFSMRCRKHKNKSIKAVSLHKASDR